MVGSIRVCWWSIWLSWWALACVWLDDSVRVEDYFLAGRNLPWLAVGMSMFASLTSATTYMGVPAFAYQHNIAMIFGVAMSLVVAPILARWFYPVYRRHRVTTSYEYIQTRFGTPARVAVSTLFVSVAWAGWGL